MEEKKQNDIIYIVYYTYQKNYKTVYAKQYYNSMQEAMQTLIDFSNEFYWVNKFVRIVAVDSVSQLSEENEEYKNYKLENREVL